MEQAEVVGHPNLNMVNSKIKPKPLAKLETADQIFSLFTGRPRSKRLKRS